MLTLKELRNRLDPSRTAKNVMGRTQLAKSGAQVLVKEVVEESTVTVYDNGLVLYETPSGATVFPFPKEGKYAYDSVSDYSKSEVPGEILEDCDWYLPLLLYGEDRLAKNKDAQYLQHVVSYDAMEHELGFMADPDSSLEEKTLRREFQEDVDAYLRLTTEKQQKLLRLYFWEGMDWISIAKMTGTTPQPVYDMKERAFRRLRERKDDLKDWFEGE